MVDSGIAPIDGSRTRWEEEQEDMDLKEGTDSKRKVPSSRPPPPPPLPAAPEEPPAPSTDAAAAVEGVGLLTASSPITPRRQEGVAAYSPALGVPAADGGGGVERNEATDKSSEAPTVTAVETKSAKQGSTTSSTDGEEAGAPCLEQATSSPANQGVDLPAEGGDGGDGGGALSQNTEAGPESGSHGATAERKDGAEGEEEKESTRLGEEGGKEVDEAKESEESAGAGKEGPCDLTKSSNPLRSTWHAEGTTVILDCPLGAKRGAYHPTIQMKDLVGRPVSGTSGCSCFGARFFIEHL